MYSESFADDVRRGLSSVRKQLPSKYFYNSKGDQLFQKIMKLDEYYLTRAELSIFQQKKKQLLELINPQGMLRVVELGAGDGVKTKVLLQYFEEQGVDFNYYPIDISPDVLDELERTMRKDLPSVNLKPIVGDYFEVLSEMKSEKEGRTVVFFLGSNVGNFEEEVLIDFLKNLNKNLRKGDCLMIGFDLKKDPSRILKAYNDPSGVTRAFNVNLLERINEDLGADFNVSNFIHYPVYNPCTGECKSYMVSGECQMVSIPALDMRVKFDAWETILMEVSRKFDKNQISRLAKNAGFRVLENVYDENRDFTDSIWEVI